MYIYIYIYYITSRTATKGDVLVCLRWRLRALEEGVVSCGTVTWDVSQEEGVVQRTCFLSDLWHTRVRETQRGGRGSGGAGGREGGRGQETDHRESSWARTCKFNFFYFIFILFCFVLFRFVLFCFVLFFHLILFCSVKGNRPQGV